MDSAHVGGRCQAPDGPKHVAGAIVAAMVNGSIRIIRGDETRSQMIALNRDDPAALDRTLAERKGQLETAVAGHASL